MDATNPTLPVRLSFDDDGDLYLLVGAARHSYRVCSRALSRASPVFSRMLYGGFAESKPARGTWTVALPEDNAIAFYTLMNIIHGRFAKVPAQVDRDRLLQITILTDKYNMTEVLRPWSRQWIEPLVSEFSDGRGYEACLWISWELGHVALFRKTVKIMQASCATNANNELLSSRGVPLADDYNICSLEILDNMAKIRLDTILQMIQHTNNTYNDLVQDSRIGARCESFYYRNGPAERKACSSFYAESFLQAFSVTGYLPTPHRLDWIRGSIHHVSRVIQAASMSMLSWRNMHKDCHKDCSPFDKLRNLLFDVPSHSCVTQNHVEHMEAQALKSGLNIQSSREEDIPEGLLSDEDTDAADDFFKSYLTKGQVTQ